MIGIPLKQGKLIYLTLLVLFILIALGFKKAELTEKFFTVEIDNSSEIINELKEYYSTNQLGMAKLYCDFILEDKDLFSDNETQIAKSLQEKIVEKEESIFYKFKSVIRGFIKGEGDDFYSILGASAGDMFVWGDIRDFIKEGYKSLKGEDYDKLTLALASFGIASSLFPQADISISILKIFAKLKAFNKTFFKTLIKILKAKRIKQLKEILLLTFKGFNYTKKYGLKPFSKMYKYVSDSKDLNKVVKLLEKYKAPKTFFAIKNTKGKILKTFHFKKPLKFIKKVKAKNIIVKTGEYLASVMVNLLGLFLSKILTIIGIVFSVIGLIGIRVIKSTFSKMWELAKTTIKVKVF